MGLSLDITLFLGRFHPLIVHLPIGILLFVAILEVIKWRKGGDLDFAVRFGLLLGTASAVLACLLGWMLAADGGYQDSNLGLHRWFGVAAAGLSALAYLLHLKAVSRRAYFTNLVILILVLLVAGHYGGSLTHGSTYLLEYAPKPVKRLAGIKPSRDRQTSLEEALVYEDAIQHIFDAKCIACHNLDKSKGDFVMMSATYLQEGGKGGRAFVPGDAAASELYKRVTLDPNHDDFMPAEGRTPMTKAEVSLLAWWIDQGAPFEKKVVDLERGEAIDRYLSEIGIGANKSFLASLELPSLLEGEFASVEKAGFSATSLVAGSGLLEVNATSSEVDLKVLEAIKEHVVWLSLSSTSINAEDLKRVATYPNLVRLKLDNTPVADEGIKSLRDLARLEYLNLYGSEISDLSIDVLADLPALKKVFVWHTNMTPTGMERLQSRRPDLEVVGGVDALVAAPPTAQN